MAFSLFSCEGNNPFNQIQRLNYYSLIWITAGSGKLQADFFEYEFEINSLITFSPFQPFILLPENKINATVLQFHPDFFCIHKHHNEVACDGVLFNNIYEPPLVKIDNPIEQKLRIVVSQMEEELQRTELAQYDSIIAYLKIFLISASRLKVTQLDNIENLSVKKEEPFVLKN